MSNHGTLKRWDSIIKSGDTDGAVAGGTVACENKVVNRSPKDSRNMFLSASFLFLPSYQTFTAIDCARDMVSVIDQLLVEYSTLITQ